MRRKLFWFSLIYLVIILTFAILFVSNLTRFVHAKGDEFFYSLYFLLGATYTFYIILYFTLLSKSWLLVILVVFSPLLIATAAFFIGFVIMALFFRGTPAEIIYIYSFSYGYLSIGAVVYWLYLKGDL